MIIGNRGHPFWPKNTRKIIPRCRKPKCQQTKRNPATDPAACPSVSLAASSSQEAPGAAAEAGPSARVLVSPRQVGPAAEWAADVRPEAAEPDAAQPAAARRVSRRE